MELKVLAQTKSDAAITSSLRATKLEAQARRDDLLGVACSMGCAIHCAAMPILVSVVPVFTSNSLLTDPLLHQVLALLCTVLVARSIIPGYLSHGSKPVAYAAAIGIAVLFLTAFVLPHHCAIPGSAAMAMASDVQAPPIHQHFSSTILSDYALRDMVGSSATSFLSTAAPFLTPIGGLLLIFAHGSNIRLRSCKDRGCRCS